MSFSNVNEVRVAGQISDADGIFPLVLVNDGSVKSVAQSVDWIKVNQAEIEDRLKSSGAVLFRGFPINSAETFDAFSAAFDYPNFTYQESLSNAVRVNFTERVFTANEAPKDVEIFLHHEMAQTPISPSKLFFFCKSAAEKGGETPLCRSDMLFAQMTEEMPELAKKFDDLGVKYTNYMPAENDANSGQGRSWKSTLSVDTAEQGEAKLKELGYSWQWMDDGSLKATTPVLPAVITMANGKKSFYNQLIAAFMGWKGVRENPSRALTFGDGSDIPKAGLERVNELSKQFTFDVPWQDGDVALVDNYSTMHGRRSFSGERKRAVMAAFAMD